MKKLSIVHDKHGIHHVAIDGNEIERVKYIGVEISADNPVRVILEFDTTNIEFKLLLAETDELVLRGKT